MPAKAFEWELNTENVDRHFDKTEQFNEYYFEHTFSDARFRKLSYSKLKLDKEIDGVKFNIPCFRVTEIESTPSTFRKNGKINIYWINLSKIKKAEARGIESANGEKYLREDIFLNDGKTFKTAQFDDTEIKACGIKQDGKISFVPINAETYDTDYSHPEGVKHCGIDETAVSDWLEHRKGSISYFSVVSSRKISIGRDARFKGSLVEYLHDQSRIRDEFNVCQDASPKIRDLNIKRNNLVEARVERDRKQIADDARRSAENAKRAQDALAAEATALRKNIKIGTRTNCGPVFDVRLPMVGVQTMIGMQYIDANQLWGPSAGCYFTNGVYIGPTR